MKKTLGIVGFISGIVSFMSIMILLYGFMKEMIVHIENHRKQRKQKGV